MYDLLDEPLPGEVMAGIARRMTMRRKEHGMTQSDLARKSGVSLGSVSYTHLTLPTNSRV